MNTKRIEPWADRQQERGYPFGAGGAFPQFDSAKMQIAAFSPRALRTPAIGVPMIELLE